MIKTCSDPAIRLSHNSSKPQSQAYHIRFSQAEPTRQSKFPFQDKKFKYRVVFPSKSRKSNDGSQRFWHQANKKITALFSPVENIVASSTSSYTSFRMMHNSFSQGMLSCTGPTSPINFDHSHWKQAAEELNSKVEMEKRLQAFDQPFSFLTLLGGKLTNSNIIRNDENDDGRHPNSKTVVVAKNVKPKKKKVLKNTENQGLQKFRRIQSASARIVYSRPKSAITNIRHSQQNTDLKSIDQRLIYTPSSFLRTAKNDTTQNPTNHLIPEVSGIVQCDWQESELFDKDIHHKIPGKCPQTAKHNPDSPKISWGRPQTGKPMRSPFISREQLLSAKERVQKHMIKIPTCWPNSPKRVTAVEGECFFKKDV